MLIHFKITEGSTAGFIGGKQDLLITMCASLHVMIGRKLDLCHRYCRVHEVKDTFEQVVQQARKKDSLMSPLAEERAIVLALFVQFSYTS